MGASLLMAVALALPVATTGCDTKPKLTEVEVPDAGITLRYDLAAGQQYTGKVSMRTSAQTPMGDIVTNLKFEVELEASGKNEPSGRLVRATIKGITVDARLPDGIPPAAAGIDPAAAAALNGMELRFNLSERGEVSNTPEPPENATPQVQAMIGMITSAMTAGLAVRLPEAALKDGESWDATNPEQDEDVKSAEGKGTLAGMARSESGEDIATLQLSATSESVRTNEAQGMSLTIKQKVDTKVSFSASGGYPVTLERKINNEIVGQATLLMEIDAEWTKGPKADVPEQKVAPAPSGDGGEVQEITDPCDPDYVGGEDCPDDAAPADEAAADGAAAEGETKQ